MAVFKRFNLSLIMYIVKIRSSKISTKIYFLFCWLSHQELERKTYYLIDMKFVVYHLSMIKGPKHVCTQFDYDNNIFTPFRERIAKFQNFYCKI